MFGYSRFIIRAATPATFVREGFRRQSGFCTNVSTTAAATLLAAVSKKNENAQPSSSTSSDNLTCKASQTTTRPNKINISCCGFPKNMIGGPSYVVESNVYGDDACFIANFKSTHVAGIADGVGGWKKYGIDPSQFSSQLMRNCADIVKEGNFEPSRPEWIISKAFNSMKVSPRPIGSSTACILIVHQQSLYSANLGDSGYLVYRNGKIIHRSQEQTHYFNAPFQLSLMPESFNMEGVITDGPEKSELHQMELEPGDVILMATDGLWDNVPESVIIEALDSVTSDTLQAACNSLALMARRLSHDEEYASPFAIKAGQHGIRTLGGKPDDITLVLLYIS